MKFTLFILLFLTASAYGQHTGSFIVEINDQSIKVTSPLKKQSTVSIIVKNNTLDKIVSELRSENKVLKRFVLKAEGKEVLQVNYSKVKTLFYVPVAPPFEAVELRFEQRPYEELTLSTVSTLDTKDEDRNDFKEFEYNMPTSMLTGSSDEYQYTSGAVTYTGYKYFKIKIVLTTSNTAKAPRLRDYRAIALQK